ncbi:MAG: diguanylate cyclase [Proteobacteria bacterium]|nr:diguanylate cyclase [Pseudomonadota bacterium]
MISIPLSKKEFFKIILPPVVAIILFVVTVFGYLLPNFKTTLIDQQKYMLRQLVNTAWNMIEVVGKEETLGHITREQGQEIVAEHLRGMRYGDDNLDYFWINDTRPYMIMHPYRPDLEGKDVGEFLDPMEKALFQEVKEIGLNDGEGFIVYEWQWKDDPTRTEPKLSFVKIYSPWGWIVGTGVYLNDVNDKIAKFSQKVVVFCGGIIFLVSLLTSFIIIQSLKCLRRRQKAEAELNKNKDHLEFLVASRTAELSQEISERKKLEEELKRITITDELTGLYNRRGFMNLAEKQLQMATRHNNVLFLLYMDLDNMKYINDHFGHEMGDSALIETGRILKDVFRESDIISRLGGDEFAALILGLSEEEKGQAVMNRFQEQLERSNSQGERPYELLISIGLTRYDSDIHCSIDDLLSEADSRMYEQKNKAKGV